MSTSAASSSSTSTVRQPRQRLPRLTPLAAAIAVLAVAGSMAASDANAQARPFSGSWMAGKGATSGQHGVNRLPNGMKPGGSTAARQQQQARAKLNRSVANLGSAAAAIAAQQAAQTAARGAAQNAASVPNGLAEGGLKVDNNPLTAGWTNAKDPIQTQNGGRTNVAIEQTADKAILNWETFNVGKNTTVDFQQQANWAALNRVNDPNARPSQIQGQIKGDGTVMIANANGVVFSGTSQVNVRNLVAAAANISDAQFTSGLYGASETTPTFTDAKGNVIVEQGAQINTAKPANSTTGGGYVLLAGKEVHNAGIITTPNGQTLLAAGDSFIIRKGEAAVDGTLNSTTRGNEVTVRFANDSTAGSVSNTGLITAATGDITLTGNQIEQAGVLLASTSVHNRGTVHLNAVDATGAEGVKKGSVTLAEGATTAILLDDSATALDSQRDSMLAPVQETGTQNIIPTDDYRRDLSLVEINSTGTVDFQSGSITLATGGQVAVNAAQRALVRDGAIIDVSGAIGVKVAMESNTIKINVQGNELRDASVNRDSNPEGNNSQLSSKDVWVDVRELVHVPAGTNGYDSDRWYTAGGLLEVGGYLGTTPHSAGEWMAQGGTVLFAGGELITQAGSQINVSGGTLDVQDGTIRQTWLKGADNRLYEVSRAPGDLMYTGLYNGYEDHSVRWDVTRNFYNPLIGPRQRFEQGYTVGRDAGRLVISTTNAVLEGELVGDTYQGARQTQAAQAGLDGYYQTQNAVARGGQLIVGSYVPHYVKDAGTLQYRLTATKDGIKDIIFGNMAEQIAAGLDLDTVLPEDRESTLYLNNDQLTDFNLGGIKVAAGNSITVDNGLAVAHGGDITLYSPQVDVNADITAHSGSIHLGNVLNQIGTLNTNIQDVVLNAPAGTTAGVTVAEGVNLDASGLWSNLLLEPDKTSLLPYQNGGSVSIRSSGDISLNQGSLIDVSSGAALQADGRLSGGRGGNIRLQSGALQARGGTLTLGGELRGHGVAGSGALRIEAGSPVAITGEPLLEVEGLLQASELVDVSLVLDQEYTVAAGEILPIDLVLTHMEPQLIPPGAEIRDYLPPGTGNWSRAYRIDEPLEVMADWVYPGSYNSGTRVRDASGRQYQSNEMIPAGTVLVSGGITWGDSEHWETVPADVFPNGLPLPDAPVDYHYAAGSAAPEAVTLSAGTVIAPGVTLVQDVAVQPILELPEDFFQKGFTQYSVTGATGLAVAPGSQVDVTLPVYRLSDAAFATATGAVQADALQLWTPPLHQQDPANARLTRRQGASLTLQAGHDVALDPHIALQVGEGAAITVDPGQSIHLRGVGQLAVEGHLTAHGGVITLGGVEQLLEPTSVHRSIWIGEQAVLDVSGRAAAATDIQGNTYGWVDNGGRIQIGNAFDPATGEGAGGQFVVVREGALLDASGASAVLDISGLGATEVASAGGDISLVSSSGLYLDGALRAEAGGVGAAGGHLSVVLDTPLYPTSDVDDRVRRVRELLLTQEQAGSIFAPGTSATEALGLLEYGHARLGADQVGGGFGSLTLASDGLLSFEGDVSLSLDQSLNLYARVLGLTDGAADDTRVELAAPHVRLAGYGGVTGRDNHIHPTLAASISVSTQNAAGSLQVHAGQLLDVRDILNIGGRGGMAATEGLPAREDRRGFDAVELVSGGDLRFLAGTQANGTQLYTSGDLTLAAAQIYPATGARATVHAGWRGSTAYDPERVLTLARTTDEVPGLPYSVFGGLTLTASTIDQGGVVRAPLGAISLGDRYSTSVNLLDGSLTSASAAGLIMPYGGTADGLNWRHAGEAVSLHGVGTLAVGSVTLTGQSVDVQEGAVIDLSGGGELTGAGFVSGRGGSTDARYHPLVQIGRDGFTLPGLDSNPVYAIVPGVHGVAPTSGEAGAADPVVGQQVTIGSGVPGLPAGTYTLLPSTYALLPGAFRLEVNGLAAQGAPVDAAAMRNGSWSVSGVMSIAGTGIQDSLASQLTLTPAETLRTYSQYNETSYADFVRADAARLGVPRALIEADAKILRLQLQNRDTDGDELSLRFAGGVLGAAAEGGYGSTLSVVGSGNTNIEIMADDTLPSADYAVAIRASDLNKMDINRMAIGNLPQVDYGQGGKLVRFQGSWASAIRVRSGVTLSAPEVMLITTGALSNSDNGIAIEHGASINTLGEGAVAYDSTDGFIYQPGSSSVVAVSNGQLQWFAPESSSYAGPGHIRIGSCSVSDCVGATQLYSEGSISFVTNNDFELDEAVRYGTRHLSLAVGAFNIGSAEALAAAAARNALTSGLALNEQTMQRLLQGDTSVGAPALETLELIAAQSVNFFEDVTLSTLDANGKSLLDNLMLTTPAIYGYGGAVDVARIQTGHFIWNGASQAPGAVAADGAGTGSGTLAIDAERITFGYGAWGQPDGISSLDRLALGFANVNLMASDRITANNKGTLAVYQHLQGEYVAGEGQTYSGGNLNITTPLITGEAGSVNKITAGGAIRVAAPEVGTADPAALNALGAELSFTAGQSLSLDTTVALPSGKLDLAAGGDLTLGDNAHVDMSGRSVTFFDDEEATQYSWGGDVSLTSSDGNIRQATGSLIDVSAQHNQGGRLTAIALADSAGVVDLQGQILGGTSGYYEAGGTYVPYLGGGIVLRAQQLGAGSLTEAFASLNQRLNEGEMLGLRSFQIKQGDLIIGNDVRANQIEVSLDGGHLTVTGTVDASGERVGSIRLAAMKGLTLASNAVLDTHSTLLRLDSYGQIIDAPNRAMVELNSGDGRLTLDSGARIDLRHGTDDARVVADPTLHDGRDRGTVELFVPRLGSATSGDMDIEAGNGLTIQGARSIAVNAVQRYDDAPDGTDPAASGRPYQVISQDYLDAKHTDSDSFMTAALGNTSLLNTKLAGFNNNTYRNAFHLRPGVEIVSKTPDGDMIVSGDLDLSEFRYQSLNPHTQKTSVYGSGEVGTLAIRAGGDLSIYGSINDGFAPPPDTPDDNGWVLTPGIQGYGGDVIVPGAGVQLAAGTRFEPSKVLNYALPIQAVSLASGTVLPTQATLASELTLPANTVLHAAVRDESGNVLYDAGTILDQDVTLLSGYQLDAGTVLPEATSLAAFIWPAGVPLPNRSSANANTNPDGVFLASDLTLPVGALIPSMTDVKLVGDAISVPLRPVSGDRMGRNWAVAKMLPEGSQSWSMRLVAGADTQAADPRLTRPDAAGRMILADTHYTLYNHREAAGRTVTVWTDAVPAHIGIPGEEVPENRLSMCDLLGGRLCEEITLSSTQIVWTDAVPAHIGTPGEVVPDNRMSMCSLLGGRLCAEVPLPTTQTVWTDAVPAHIGTPGEVVPDNRMSMCSLLGGRLCAEVPLPGAGLGDTVAVYPIGQNFSVLRTGTGDLDLIAAGDVSMQSPYGVYTAGTSTASRAGEQGAAFDLARARGGDDTFLGTAGSAVAEEGAAFEALVDGGADSTYAAWYPDGGGNLLLRIGGNLTGDLIGSYGPAWPGQELRAQRSSVDQGNWLWRQSSGNTTGVDPIATSWWINFGSYVPGSAVSNNSYDLDASSKAMAEAIPELVGFTGLGTLGGGNLTVDVAGDAGMLARRGLLHNNRPRSEGLALAIGSTGRVAETGELLLTGGGDLNLRVGGNLNPGLEARVTDDTKQNLNLNGVLSNLRGGLHLQVGEIGGIDLTYYSKSYNQVDSEEVRAFDPYTASLSTATGGLVLMLGDSAASLNTRGDLVLSGTGDPGRVALPYTPEDDGYGWFSLWTENTAIDLFAAGGDLTPSVQLTDVTLNTSTPLLGHNHSTTDGRFIYPSQLSAVAADGSIYLGKSTLRSGLYNDTYHLLLAPSTNGSLDLLAGDSIYAGGYTISQSGASLDALAKPFAPAYAQFPLTKQIHNLSDDALVPTSGQFSLFSFGPNTYSGEFALAQPARMYARDGDIVGLSSGSISRFVSGNRTGQSWYEGAGPVWTRAGGDIVRFGSFLLDESLGLAEIIGVAPPVPNAMTQTVASTSGVGYSAGNVIVHNDISDVSVIEAGGNILYSGFSVVGPGTLEITAGGNILMAGQAGQEYAETAITSLGPILPGDNRPGASIVMQAGFGTQGARGADFTGFLAQYLNPVNLADAEQALADQEDKVAKTYEAELIDWLDEQYGFAPVDEAEAGSDAAAQALAYFATLSVEQQRIFARQVYFAELRAGGREYNDPNGPRFGSYLRGRNAIAALFPEQDAVGDAVVYSGDILMYGGSGVHTNVGGDVQMLTPGGQQVFGVDGEAPPATAGVITRGQGDIQMYSLGSILLGQSRIMTTFGGDILGWSAQGDINAGRGSNTTVVYTPPSRIYDNWGNVTISPVVPSTGAGIATLNPIAEVAPGSVDLIAPLGTIDAGEAGIRVSGDINIAALHVANAANIQVQGESTGIPVMAAVNVGALTSASAASASAATAATDTISRARNEARQNQPSIFSVQILGFGNESASSSAATGGAMRTGPAATTQEVSYRPNHMVQIVGRGELTANQMAALTADEQKHLGL